MAKVKCVSCGSDRAEILISGKLLCPKCSRQEILHRVRRNLGRSGINLRGSRVILTYPEFYRNEANLLKSFIEKVCSNCNFTIKEIEISGDGQVNKVMRDLVLTSIRESENQVILPFTADFFAAYLIYSSGSPEGSYLSLYGLRSKVSDKVFISPLYDTPLTELRGFSELTGELKTGDELFNGIIEWLHSEFKDNEVFHTFPPSIPVIVSRFATCKRCGALTKSEYCRACSVELALEK
ncbi:hypothetical protein DFR87_10125 [Metallosphaera hakonensis JCM 8857 = DSM 7519]|uniref:Uncharacterized protein n=1 Tax=Metallosphaera hakonensis JCM 8857 = DSM 7519 TaxID=1293036 RepID=A0A2U9IVC1_9CREN|nr:hypothetical protein DFR87_10125 [Metallosphaera hakonensis JCM 8857 = DSM 7519]